MLDEPKKKGSGADKARCSGRMTEAQFITFVKNQLRGASWKWFPISETLKKARVSKGWYRCAGCDHIVPTTKLVDGKRVKWVSVDHVDPIIDPEVGFKSWDDFINNLFCEEENLQLLCRECHDGKSSLEKNIAVERRRKEKEDNG